MEKNSIKTEEKNLLHMENIAPQLTHQSKGEECVS
jgi:hypothetical protein